MAPTTLTIGMATHRDFDGVYFTVNALRLYHAGVLPRCELVIVDNDPDGPQAEQLRGFCAHLEARRAGWPQPFAVQYIPFRTAIGTAAPRDHVFRVAQGDAVMVLDSHVNLWPGALAKLLDWYDTHPDSRDLVQGPLVYDDLATVSTHFADVWRDGMWGTWDTDPRGVDPDAEPFEIPAQGLGLFSCRKDAWLGFNPHFREFGGEEWYIHEKFRQAGRRCLCLPFLRWVHRFSAPSGGRAYQFTVMGKVRNYILGLQELGLSLDRLRKHYVNGLNEDPQDPVNRDAHLTEEQFAALVRDPVRHPVQLDSDSRESGSSETNGQRLSNGQATRLEDLYRRAAATPSDINEHCGTLRELASQCETVVEFGMRHGVSTVALLAGQPRHLISVDLHSDPIVDVLSAHAGTTSFEFRLGSSLAIDIPNCDLLFIDTRHTEAQLWGELSHHAGRVRRWIALHDTEVYGEFGEDGEPGLLPALARFLQDHNGWRPVYHSRRNHGFTVISCEPDASSPWLNSDPIPTCLVTIPAATASVPSDPLDRG
jgi:hypothetical protein